MVLFTDRSYNEAFKREILYLGRKTQDLYGECILCTEQAYRYCTHYQLNKHDITILNILRYIKKIFECPICYEEKPYADGCGGACFDRHGNVCYGCVTEYECNKFVTCVQCARCKNIWCRSCNTYITCCPFCRTTLN